MNELTLLLVEDDLSLREALVDTLLLAKYQIIDVASAEDAIVILKQQDIDLVISDVQMQGLGGMGLLQYMQQEYSHIPLLLMTAFASIDKAVAAMKLGAVDYLSKPFSSQLLLDQVARYIKPKINLEQAVAEDAQTKALFNLACKVAHSDASVMIMGPSGSGKEVMARYIHQHSQRSEQDFVAINCAAIPENMLEATLFGYEKGAFTGAYQACPGKFEQANGGTLLLDEISEMDLGLQAKLLRVLQEQEVERLGGRKPIKLDVRILATSNRDLTQMVKEGLFREDLFYRINVFPIEWLPLKQRKDDILPLAQHLLVRHVTRQQLVPLPQFSAAAEAKLLAHEWPGNVRELDNVMQRALILQQGQWIEADDLIIDGVSNNGHLLTNNQDA